MPVRTKDRVLAVFVVLLLGGCYRRTGWCLSDGDCADPGLTCNKMTKICEDPGRRTDLAPQVMDLAQACAPDPANLLLNPSFELGQGMANNVGAPPSTVNSWDACCNLDMQGLTTTWTITAQAGQFRCGAQAVAIASTAAHGDVLDQTLTISNGAGRSFTLIGWFKVPAVDASSSLYLDLFDLVSKVVVAESPHITMPANDSWGPLIVTGLLPMGPGPQVQVRIKSAGNVRAFADDLSLVLR